MAKQLNVSLSFNADTAKAKAQIQDLQNTLNQLVKGSAASSASSGRLGITKDLMEAQVAATKLQTILNQSMNPKTGNLDLTKFSESFNKAGMDLSKLKTQLDSLGPTGQKAFMSLASSIVSADVPLKRTNALVSELWTTMKNTARWQLSSSVLHGFMGTIQSATSYARDLDESLNNIRIVTGQSAEQMAAFADRANKAAKALSTTTTEYTNASLIYYQQGLNDQEVQDRADITIKMAQASGQSAEIVSDQLTAIWNNFYDGSKSLEHYADVLTSLGAATASSSDEISAGLEKFASIADMIGLSYEYAASALATITATTRQSEDVVGTALKTIFARIQGLSLGETLEDGTNLNKYSEALQKVGISIFEQNGELKDMDNILNEMGDKWETLSKDQRVALAQTVAGVRQYNQLVSLMDNWDFFESNLDIANSSDGALQEQADIYAESWQAARDRVKAAAQDIYDSILDPDFFITLLDGFEKLLSGVANFSDALNGLPGVLSLLGVILTKTFSTQLANSIDNMAFSLKSMVGLTKQEIDQFQQLTLKEVNKMSFNTGTEAGDAEAMALKRRLQLQNEIRNVAEGLSENQREQLVSLLEINDAYAEQAIKAAQVKDAASDKVQETASNMRSQIRRASIIDEGTGEELSAGQKISQFTQAQSQLKSDMQAGIKAGQQLKWLTSSISESSKNLPITNKYMSQLMQHLNGVGRTKAAEAIDKLTYQLQEGTISTAQYKKKIQEIITVEELLEDTIIAGSNNFRERLSQYNLTEEQCDKLANEMMELAQAEKTSSDAARQASQANVELKASVMGFKNAMDSFGQSVVKSMQGISQISMGIMSLKGAWDTLNNSDLSFGEKLLQVTMSLSMAIPSLIMGINALRDAELGRAFATVKTNAALVINNTLTAIKANMNLLTAATDTTAAATSTTLTGSLLAQAAAWVAVQLSIAPLAALLLVVVGGIVALVAVSAGLVALFNAIKNSSPEAKLKALQEQAEKSAEAFNKVQESVNATKEAIDSLKESYEVIEGLKQGTEEWNEAISNTNAQVLNLLENYPDIEKFIYSEDGVLKLYQEGYDTIENTDAARLAAANNLKISDQVAVAEQELNNSYYDFKTGSGGALPSSYAKVLQSAYEDLGEQLFTQESSDEILRVLQESNAALGYTNESFYEAVKANEELIKSNSAKQNYINTLEDYQLESTVSSTGTTRSAEEIRSLMGEESSYDAMRSEKRAEVVSSFDNDWNDYIDYNKSNAKQWSMIEDFMSTKGEDVEYVAQKGGKMVIKVDGEEQEYSAKEFYDTLAELYTAPEFVTSFEDKLKESLRDTLGNAVDGLSTDDIVEIDNFKQGLINTFTDLGASEDYSNKTFNAMADLYKNEEDPSAGIEDFIENISYVDTSSEEFINLANAIATVNSEAEKLNLKTQLEDLNAQGQIETMGGYFSQEAEAMGLDESAGAEMHDYARQLMEVDEQSEILDDNLSSNAEAAAEVATSVTRMNKGIDTLADNFTDWNDILKKSDKSSAEYSKAINGMRDALGDVLDVESDIIDNDFIEEHLEEIEKAATGDAEAIDALKAALAQDVLLEVVGVSKFEELNQDIQNLHNQILGMDDEIKVGAVLEGNDQFLADAQKLVDTSKMSVDEAQAYFNSLGYEPEFVTEEQTATRSVPIERTHTDYELTTTNVTADLGPFGSHTLSLPGFDRLTTTSVDGFTPVEEKIQVPALSSDGTPTIKKLTKKSSGAMNNYSGSNSGGKKPGSGSGSGGGSGSKPKKATPTKKSDILDRYKQVTDLLDDVGDSLDDASKAADRLYGGARIAQMKNVNNLLQKEVGLLKDKRVEAEKYLSEEDLPALQKSVAGFGLEFTFDGKGNISNYDSIMGELYGQLETMETNAGDEWDDTESEEIEALKEKIEAVKDAIAQYDETRELMEDIDNEIQEKIYEWQDNNYELLQYELELKVDIEDSKLKRLDYFINKFSDDFYKMNETVEKMIAQGGNYENFLNTYISEDQTSGYIVDLKNAYEAGEISQDAYIEGLKESRDAIYDQLNNLIDLDKEMMHFYEDTLNAASEELADYTDHMEHLNGVFDHYINLSEILGKQKDWGMMGDFLSGKASVTRDQLDVAKEYYQVMLDQQEDIQKQLEQAKKSGSEEDVRYWQEQWDAIVDATDEAQEEVLALTEEWASAMKAVFENDLAEAFDTLEKKLTEGMGFEKLLDDFDKLNLRQEEFLTKTNQIYETNKLMRTASKALDETDNKVAKQKLKNFIDETKSLQENTQLSQYELEIQQAKYDLLLAEIALEEAQNAKSTVRLSRDSEGNFGYVYTADQDAVDDAQQGVEDAENNLYNISLEGQQNYTEKYLQAHQQMLDDMKAVTDAYAAGEITSAEEVNQRLAEIQEHYYGVPDGILTTYSKLYNVAVRTDSDATADYWGKEYGAMTQDTETWKTAVTGFIAEVNTATGEWELVSEQANEDVGDALDNSAKKTEELTDESENLKDMINDEVIPAIEDELEAVQKQIEEYGNARDAILEMIAAYEEYLALLDQEIEKASEEEAPEPAEPPEAPETPETPAEKPAQTSGYGDTVTWTGSGANRVWKDSNGNTYAYGSAEQKALQKAFDKAYTANGGYKGDYFLGWNTLDVDELKKYGLSTGGYTGEWGPEGKVAMLHEKELVLNKEDTENILKTVGFIREIINSINSQASMSSLFNMTATSGISTSSSAFEQTVTIHAEFPNATNHSEIEEAFNNLVNRASQYANRK